jgi:hypothetical protein
MLFCPALFTRRVKFAVAKLGEKSEKRQFYTARVKFRRANRVDLHF